MNPRIPSPNHSQTSSQPELLAQGEFDYTSLPADMAGQVQTAAGRIRQMVKQTLEVLIAVGNELLAVKAALPHGRFGPWLRAEFGWTERTARNFMAVAERFGTKTEIISDLRIDPTAAYLLAAPSTPEVASAVALERAERGERITVSVAREILGMLRSQGGGRRIGRRQGPWPTNSLGNCSSHSSHSGNGGIPGEFLSWPAS